MNCKNLRIRTKKGVHYKYCILLKKIITDECYNCINKEYKCTKSLNYCAKLPLKKKKCTIKGHKHKLTKATEIPMKVKKEVWERDNHCCIYCHKYVDVYYANSHYIKRSHLGKGIPQNVVTACPKCHDKYDFGVGIEDMIKFTKEYLISKYNNWNEEGLIYKKS